MTEMEGLSITQCEKCHYCIKLYDMISYCYNAKSKHYGHVIMDFHPVCNEFTKRVEEEKK
jgi:hypothetical protein